MHTHKNNNSVVWQVHLKRGFEISIHFENVDPAEKNDTRTSFVTFQKLALNDLSGKSLKT